MGVGGAVASWLVCSSPDRVVWVLSPRLGQEHCFSSTAAWLALLVER